MLAGYSWNKFSYSNDLGAGTPSIKHHSNLNHVVDTVVRIEPQQQAKVNVGGQQ